MQDYLERVEKKSKNQSENNEKLKKIQSIISFDKQLNRKVSNNPTIEKTTFIDTSKGHIRTILFEKFSSRKELFTTGLTIAPYDTDKEKLFEKVNKTQIEFNKMPSRKELLLEHMLNTPKSINLEDFEKAYSQQSNVRGAFKIPGMARVTPRDDLMYRVTEAYNLNIPDVQSAQAKPKFLGDQTIKEFKSTLVRTV